MRPLQILPSLLLAFTGILTAPLCAEEGMATYFLGIGFPYGGCGVPEEVAGYEAGLDTLTGQGNPIDYVALNVYDTPQDYTPPGRRPLVGADTARLGLYDNGRNCGRWLRFQLGDTCDGANDGAMNQPFCRGGTGWHPNAYTGSGLVAIVFDQCTDGNAWCRDSRGHLDLHASILGRLRRGDSLLPPLAIPVLDASGQPKADPNNPWAIEYQVHGFQNPKVQWEFVPAPNYQGEPRFWFSQGSKPYYIRLIVTHLPNGIHGLEQRVGEVWKPATMDGDAGQMWLLPDPSATTYTVRLTDALDQPVLGGRTWTFDFPAACGSACDHPATLAEHLRAEGGVVGVSDIVRPSPVPLLRILGRSTLHFGLPLEGRVSLLRADGTVVPDLAVRNGSAPLPELSRGIWIARWDLLGSRGTARVFVP